MLGEADSSVRRSRCRGFGGIQFILQAFCLGFGGLHGGPFGFAQAVAAIAVIAPAATASAEVFRILLNSNGHVLTRCKRGDYA